MHFVLSSLLLAGAASATLYPNQTHHACARAPQLTSCSAAALDVANVDTCCTETFGGLLSATQFWDTHTGRESQGQLLPKDSWTLHGLWPDFCNGSFTQYCDFNRQYDPHPSPDHVNGVKVPKYQGPSIATFIEQANKTDMLDWMNKYWVAQGQPNDQFWAHEFSKHATCYSTFDVPCYSKEQGKHADVIDFFQTAIDYFEKLPTFKWLAQSNITPSNTTTYSLDDITNALKKQYGKTPYIGCSGPAYKETPQGKGSDDSGRTILNEVWYFGHARGRPQNGDFIKLDATTHSSCAKAKGAIQYQERIAHSVRN